MAEDAQAEIAHLRGLVEKLTEQTQKDAEELTHLRKLQAKVQAITASYFEKNKAVRGE